MSTKLEQQQQQESSELLSQEQDLSYFQNPHLRQFKDIGWTALYVFAMIIWINLSIILCSSDSASLIPFPNSFPNLVYSLLKSSIHVIYITTAVSLVVGFVWLYLLFNHVKSVIAVTIISIPSLLIALSISSLILSFKDTQSHFWFQKSGWVSTFIGLLLMSFTIILLLIHKRKEIEKTVEIIQMSVDILKSNPSIFIFSLLLLLFHGLFSLIWLTISSRIFHVGNVSSIGKEFIWSYSGQYQWFVCFFLLIFFWTSAIFQNIERVVIGAVVGDWYFNKHTYSGMNSTYIHAKAALTTSFGSICFGSLILGTISTLKFISNLFKRASHSSNRSPSRFITGSLNCFIHFLEEWTPFTLIVVGISGNDLCSSARECTHLFRRNLILGFVSSSLSKLIITFGNLAVSALVGLVIGSLQTHFEHPYGYILISLGTLIPFYMLRFIGCIILNTMDATFICYLLDLDSSSCNCSSAHRIFAH